MSTKALAVMVLCGDVWHPAEMVQLGLGALGGSRYAFEFVTQGDSWSPALLEKYPVVVVAKANHLSTEDRRPWLTEEKQGAIQGFVRQGGGMLLLHGGVGYKDLPAMRAVAGGAFMRHPDQGPVTVVPQTDHPLTAGVKTFTMLDEHYFMAVDAPDAEVFLRSYSEHGIQPAGWRRQDHSGRVVVLTPGHNPAVWMHPDFQTLLGNSLAWVAGQN